MDTLAEQLDTTTVLSLGAVVAILTTAYSLSVILLPRSTTTAHTRVLFIWHLFDFLIHSIFEGSFLYNCFFASAPAPAHLLPTNHFLGRPDRVFGSRYADNWAAQLWMVYAKADRRWAEADLTVVSLELLTVLGAGPLALWICYAIWRGDVMRGFWMVVLATGELYGGFMTFCPEWLTGSENLDTSNFMFLWVYLVFFNMLWVVLPLYAIWYAYVDMRDAFLVRKGLALASLKTQGELKRR